ncbi:M12 family metallo-peptidase, partial [Burkholderia sp. AW49-1]
MILGIVKVIDFAFGAIECAKALFNCIGIKSNACAVEHDRQVGSGSPIRGLKFSGVVCAFLVLCGGTAAATAEPGKLMRIEGVSGHQRIARVSDQYIRSLEKDGFRPVLVNIDPSVISDRSQDIEIDLGEGKTVTARKQRYSVEPDGISAWDGEVQVKRNMKWRSTNEVPVDALNEVTLIRHGNNVAGLIRTDRSLYQIAPVGDGEHAIFQVTPGEEFHDDDDIPAVASEPNAVVPRNLRSSHSTIRVMTVITNQVREKWADVDANVALAIQLANDANVNSHVNITFENAGIFNANYNESGTYSEMLAKIRNIADAQLGGPVHAFREAHRADLVVMLAASSVSNGTAYNNATKTSAFSVVRDSYAIAQYTFAHEMAHNIGASHDLEQYIGKEPKVPTYVHGFKLPGRWRTIMSYDCKPACPRVLYWSNPDQTYEGVRMGSAQFENVARRLNERREIVAAFYPPPVQATPPTVVATISPTAIDGAGSVTLDASRSTDTSGGTLRFAWSQFSGLPALAIDDSDKARAVVHIPGVDEPTVYTFKVVVTNDAGLSESKQVKVEAHPSREPITATLTVPAQVRSGEPVPVQ